MSRRDCSLLPCSGPAAGHPPAAVQYFFAPRVIFHPYPVATRAGPHRHRILSRSRPPPRLAATRILAPSRSGRAQGRDASEHAMFPMQTGSGESESAARIAPCRASESDCADLLRTGADVRSLEADPPPHRHPVPVTPAVAHGHPTMVAMMPPVRPAAMAYPAAHGDSAPMPPPVRDHNPARPRSELLRLGRFGAGWR